MQGSLAGTPLVPPIPFVPPTSAPFWQGSVAPVVAWQDPSRLLKPFFTGPLLPLFPGEEPITLPSEKLPEAPLCIAAPRALAPFLWPKSSEADLPGAKPPTHFDPNVVV